MLSQRIQAPTLSRRQWLMFSSVTLLIPQGRARSEQQPPRTAADLILEDMRASPVRPALSPRQYLDKIVAARPAAWEQLEDLLENSKFKEAAESLVLYPFDDVAQGSFYLPWALLETSDESTAVKVQGAYLELKNAIVEFESVCREAGSYRAEDENVRSGLDHLTSTLDSFLKVVNSSV